MKRYRWTLPSIPPLANTGTLYGQALSKSATNETTDQYLFDVGVIALAHTDAPVRDAALEYVQAGIRGDIDAVVPHATVIGAHNVLTTYYGRSNAAASRLLQNFLDAKRIHWYDEMAQEVVESAFSLASDANVDGWDGYYAAVAKNESVNTVVTIDDDFERFDAFETEIVLSPEQFRKLNRYLSG